MSLFVPFCVVTHVKLDLTSYTHKQLACGDKFDDVSPKFNRNHTSQITHLKSHISAKCFSLLYLYDNVFNFLHTFFRNFLESMHNC